MCKHFNQTVYLPPPKLKALFRRLNSKQKCYVKVITCHGIYGNKMLMED